MNMKEGSMSKKDEPSKRMKQLELEFVGILTEYKRVEPEVVEIEIDIENEQATPQG